MRNIHRVILWGLPPSFCSLVQRAGRAARDMTQLGEAILIVPAKVLKDGASIAEVSAAVEEIARDAEAQNRDVDALDSEALEMGADSGAGDGVEIVGNQRLLVSEGGLRVATVDEDEEEVEVDPPAVGASTKKRKKHTVGDCNAIEARYLTQFATTTRCRRFVWNVFFKNMSKRRRQVEVFIAYANIWSFT